MAAEALSERPPTREETEKASEAINAMARAMTNEGALPFKVSQDGAEVRIELPPAVCQLLLDLLGHIASGEMVTLVPYGTELTTQKAADLLNISRPFLTKLLEAGEIRFHHVGVHRRIRVKHLLEYKERRDKERENAMNELQHLGQEYDAK